MHINILTFSPLVQSLQIDVYTDKIDNKFPLKLFNDEFPELWEDNPELSDKQYLFFSFFNAEDECTGDKYSVELIFNEHPRLARHYFNDCFYNYFKVDHIVGVDYVDNVEVWIEDTDYNDKHVTQHLRFSLIPKFKAITNGWELIVSFNGYSRVYKNSLSTLDLHTDSFRVIAKNEVLKYKKLTPEYKQDISNIYPVINRELTSELNVSEYKEKVSNKFTNTLEKIEDFANNYLLVEDFQNVITFNVDMFIKVPEANISQVYENSNTLLFGNGGRGYDPYSSLFRSPFNNNDVYGPYLPTNKDVKFFFIYHKPLENVCFNLYNIFLYGINSDEKIDTNKIDIEKEYKKYIPLSESIKHPFNTVENGSISFNKLETAIEEVEIKLNNMFVNKDTSKTQYVAIYVSSIHKDDVNSPHHSIYYKIKEILLNKRITSQVIHKSNPSNSSFKYHLPNIAIALLAKIGGIPWVLRTNDNENDLIVGVGAFRSEKIGKRYIGSAFCFNNNGVFQDFASYKDKDIDSLVSDIRRAIGFFLVNNQDRKPNRLIIHYYKTMSHREAKPITEMLFNLGFKIPIYVVTINKTEASDFVAYDTKLDQLVPMSGTFIKISYNQFLLYNNARYKNSKKFDPLFPVKVKISKVVTPKDIDEVNTNKNKDIPMSEVKDLLNQVYQFSRMYWKSVKQQNLPITIKYPEMVAEIVPHFTDEELPPFGKSNLWFL